MKRIKLNPEQVKKYEEMSGFKTTGDVEVVMQNDAVMDAYYEALVPPKEQNNPVITKRGEK